MGYNNLIIKIFIIEFIYYLKLLKWRCLKAKVDFENIVNAIFIEIYIVKDRKIMKTKLFDYICKKIVRNEKNIIYYTFVLFCVFFFCSVLKN